MSTERATRPEYRDTVRLTPYGPSGQAMDVVTLSYYDYYDGDSNPIDDSEWICKLQVKAIAGEIYNGDGELQSFFISFYDDQGTLVSGKQVHADGTVTA